MKKAVAMALLIAMLNINCVYAQQTTPLPKLEKKIEKQQLEYERAIPLDIKYQKFLYEQCEEYKVPYNLALAVIDQETGGTFNSNLISPTSDYGLFQINKVHHEWLYNAGCTNLLKPEHNIIAGLMILSNAIERTDTLEEALVMYNMGSGASKGINSTPYSRSVINKMKGY